MAWDVKKYPAYYGGVKQAYPNIAPGEPFFSRSAVVGNLIFLSGVDGRALDTGKVQSNVLEEQMVVALDKVRLAMEEAGSSLNGIIKTVHLLTNQKDIARMWRRELEYYQEHAPWLLENPPASTFIEVPALSNPESLVETDIIGVIHGDTPGWEMKKYAQYYGEKKYPLHYGEAKSQYARSVVVGNLIFLSGSAGAVPETGKVESDVLEEQLRIALDGIRFALEEAGSTMNNIVKTVMLLKNVEDYTLMRKAEVEYYLKYAPLLLEEPPASTFIPCSLARPWFLAEIYAIGVISRDKPGWEMKKYPYIWVGKKAAYPHVPLGAPMFSRTAIVGNLVFCSGSSGIVVETGEVSSGDVAKQTVVALDKIKAMLEEAGSSMNNIIKTFILLKDMKDYPRMRKTELEYYQKHAPLLVEEPPASTAIQVVTLHKPSMLVEIDAIAVIPDGSPQRL